MSTWCAPAGVRSVLQAAQARQIGTRIEGYLGQAAGGIVVTFSTVAPMPTLAQWYARGQYALQWLALLVMAVLAVMGLLYLGLRQMCRPYVQVAQRRRRLCGLGIAHHSHQQCACRAARCARHGPVGRSDAGAAAGTSGALGHCTG